MAHEKLELNISPEWLRDRAKVEPENGITSVGGLANRMDAQTDADPKRKGNGDGGSQMERTRRQCLGKLIELSRRRLRLSIGQLAERAGLDQVDLKATENGGNPAIDPEMVHRLAKTLGLRPEPLLELAGLRNSQEVGLNAAAIRFAARLDADNALTSEEEDALNWFVAELAKA